MTWIGESNERQLNKNKAKAHDFSRAKRIIVEYSEMKGDINI